LGEFLGGTRSSEGNGRYMPIKSNRSAYFGLTEVLLGLQQKEKCTIADKRHTEAFVVLPIKEESV